ncbi:metalloregulator ArsR/SmtB family transcription factor [Spongiactinospora sp. TRM90649]|uniref:ArsR/SmtB family transcription factor n=1 Tax=Spongiactinospora sp. TRM90649 TaxID=3031114 RepID=UPI0023F67EF2|nr:metalloregulator ArsR/SmtB family transcription factor [Spongiactinospora sp. TRM90649]MDF5752736.1 metalloregulator ArsR/SmtB family transcription factor [Spongiactinospora sp. TRM90649]
MDTIFKALADTSRRRLLDSLNARNGQSLRELCADLDMTRQAVTKHLAVLEAAGLVATIRRGREKLHYLNAAPIIEITDRWIGRYDRHRVEALADLKHALEGKTVSKPEFVYVTYIQAGAERVWQALTEPAFTRRYWGGVALSSDWQVGSPVLWQNAPGEEFRDLGQYVLESEPNRRLSYSWHPFQPEHAELFGWDADRYAEALKERRSKVTFEIEAAGEGVKLTVIHDDFDEGSAMLAAISGGSDRSGGWPELLSGLKTLLETGRAPLESAGVSG